MYISVSTSVNLTLSSFSDNVAIGDGGAISIFDSNITLHNAVFEKNSAGIAGAISVQTSQSTISVYDTEFTTNSAWEDAGAIRLKGNAHSFSGCTFTANLGLSNTSSGGAIEMRGVQQSVFSSCTFNSNSADEGGAVHSDAESGSNTFVNCGFRNNSCITVGGAVDIIGTGQNNFTHCTFEHNWSFLGAAGGLALSAPDNVVEHCVFSHNSIATAGHDNPSWGGAAVWLFLSHNNAITHSSFHNNSAMFGQGGAIAISASDSIQLHHNVFSNNSADFGGGVVIGNSHAPTITWNHFSQNHAELRGGALDIDGPTGTSAQGNIENCVFSSNVAAWGAAVSFSGEANGYTIDQTNFTDNFASQLAHVTNAGEGAACYLSPTVDDIFVLNCQFIHNKAQHSGGVTFISGNVVQPKNIYFNDSVFRFNSAPQGMLFYPSEYDALIIFNSTLDHNCSPLSTCHSHGTCSDIGLCECDIAWKGDDECTACSPGYYPPNSCANKCTCEHGVCDSNGHCECDLFFTGANCNAPNLAVIVPIVAALLLGLISALLIVSLLLLAAVFAMRIIPMNRQKARSDNLRTQLLADDAPSEEPASPADD